MRTALILALIWATMGLETAFGGDILHFAIKEIGRAEIGGDNKGQNVKKYTRGIESAWCAGFVSYVLHKSGHDDLGYILSAREYYNKGKRVINPKPGDIICFWRGKKNGWMGHVGIVERVTETHIYTIEGNRGPYPAKVKRVVYNRNNIKNLLGFVRI